MPNIKLSVTLIIFINFLVISTVIADKTYEQKLDAWFNSDSDQPPIKKINSSGKLTFLTKKPQQQLHHHHNIIEISSQNLNDGWVKLTQCHYHLQPFPRAQVVYNKAQSKNIIITQSKQIEKAWVENSSVQLINIKKNSTLCISMLSKALTKNKDNSFTLKNGPFMRRFLDGYFPMRVSLEIRIPKELKVASITPTQQAGFNIQQTKSKIHLDAWFEGKLYTIINFRVNKP